MYPAHTTLSQTTGLQPWPSVHPAMPWRGAPTAQLGNDQNPLYASKYLRDYQEKVACKEEKGLGPLWSKRIGAAFFDAILLLPPIGKRKYRLRGSSSGRNMLICEYIRLHQQSLSQPGPGEGVSLSGENETGHPPHPGDRTRKQVSSHFQVLKRFFKTLPLFHFFFPQKNQAQHEERSPWDETDDLTKAFDENPVIAALLEGHLPKERPNYAYFAHLLEAESEVFLRPEMCHIYLSRTENGSTTAKAGGACLHADDYTPSGVLLGCQDDFPQPGENNHTGTGHDVHRCARDQPQTYLLHAYTWSLAQSESGSVGDIAFKWHDSFPKLQDKLVSALNETQPFLGSPARDIMGPCDIIHMEVTLTLPERSRFPTGTHLDARVEFSINRPELVDHLWCSSTCVVKPSELHLSASEPPVWDRRSICPPSRCSGAPNVIVVEFPVMSWGSTLYQLAKYAEAERENACKPTEGCGEECLGSPTLCDMLQQVAMFQEIWSAPNKGSGQPAWTRRAVVLWTFSAVCADVDGAGDEPLKEPPQVKSGSTWRFLSKLGSMSRYHQQRVYLPGADVPDDDTQMPDQGGQHDPGSVLYENVGYFPSGGFLAFSDQLPKQHAHLVDWNMLAGRGTGLAAPQFAPYFDSNYLPNFDGGAVERVDTWQAHPSYPYGQG